MKIYHLNIFDRASTRDTEGNRWPEVEQWLNDEYREQYELVSLTTAFTADGRQRATVVTKKTTILSTDVLD